MYLSSHRRALPSPLAAMVAVLAAASSSMAGAQSGIPLESCNAALAKDVISSYEHDVAGYAYFSQVDEETYRLIKNNVALGFTSKVPVLGDMLKTVSGSATYDGFNEARRAYFEQVGYQSNSAHERQYVNRTTSATAFAAWSRCVDQLAASQFGIVAFKRSEDAQYVHVTIVNRSNNNVRITGSTLLNGKVRGVPSGRAFVRPVTLRPNTPLPLVLERAGPGRLTLSITTDGPGVNLIQSDWATSPPGPALTGELRDARDTVVMQDRGEVGGESWRTIRLHNPPSCNRAPVTVGGGLTSAAVNHWFREYINHAAAPVCHHGRDGALWAQRTLWLPRTPDNHVYSAPRITCKPSGSDVCVHYTRVDRCELTDDRRGGFCTVSVSSDVHEVQVVARLRERVPVSGAPVPILAFSGQTFLLTVPISRVGKAYLRYQTSAGTSVLEPGDKASKDELLQLVGLPVITDGAHHYTYRYQPKQTVAGGAKP